MPEIVIEGLKLSYGYVVGPVVGTVAKWPTSFGAVSPEHS